MKTASPLPRQQHRSETGPRTQKCEHCARTLSSTAGVVYRIHHNACRGPQCESRGRAGRNGAPTNQSQSTPERGMRRRLHPTAWADEVQMAVA